MCLFIVSRLATQISKTYRYIHVSLSTSGLGDCKVARVGRPPADYKLVVRRFDHASHANFPRSDNYYVRVSVEFVSHQNSRCMQ